MFWFHETALCCLGFVVLPCCLSFFDVSLSVEVIATLVCSIFQRSLRLSPIRYKSEPVALGMHVATFSDSVGC